MSRLVDSTICPDCRALLDEGATCTSCGLQVRGPLAVQLWGVMVTADRLIEQLRGAAVTVPSATVPSAIVPSATAPTAGSAADRPSAPALPHYPVPAAAPPAKPRRLPSASVPVVLLSLGALCLLVAATVFVAVAWSLLGLTGRTLVLLGFTALLAVIAVTLTRKGLRSASETFWLVVSGMLVVDLLGAQSAGLAGLDALDWRGTGALVGASLLALGTGVGAWARHQPVTRLYGAEAVAALGALVVVSTNAWFAENIAVATTVAVPLLAALALVLRRAVPLAAYAVAGLAATTWLVLLGAGWDRALETATLPDWWAELRGWPLVVAAVFAAALVHLPGVASRVRPVAAGLALLPLAVLANGPQTDGLPTRDLVTWCVTLVALGLVAALAPTAWARGAAALTSVGIALLGLWLMFTPWDVLTYLEPDGRSAPGLTMSAQVDNAASWSFVVAALALVVAAACAVRQAPAGIRAEATRVVGTVAPAVLALGTLVLVLELEPPLWVGVLAAALATAVASGATWWSRDHAPAAVLGSVATAYLTVVMLYAASASDLLIALTTTALALTLGVACALREMVGVQPSAALLGSLTVLAGSWALVAWSVELSADVPARALALAVYAGLAAVVASPLTRSAATRVAVEASAAVLAVLATGYSADERTMAMVLTIVGTAICVLAVTTRDRVPAGWTGAVVLGVATVIRVLADVSAPELYTLPAAALLVGAGAWRLHTDRGTSSFTTLGSGVTLALLPSLLLALDEPVSLRGALVGAAAVLTLAAGVQQRLAAPFVLGAVATGVLAVRHLQPVADAVPRWISLGGVGLVLLLVGVTWEARRRNLETAHRYLTDLR